MKRTLTGIAAAPKVSWRCDKRRGHHLCRAADPKDIARTLEKRGDLIELDEDKWLRKPRSDVAEERRVPVWDLSKLKDGELPRIAIVGRPNVGKSALLNRLTQSSKAIVYDKPGVTRDRLLVRAFWRRSEFMLMDTGGLPDTKVVMGVEGLEGEIPADQEIPVGVEKQVAAAVDECDLVLFVVDGKEGPMDGDTEILDWLRKQHSDKPVRVDILPVQESSSGRQVLLAVNKCEKARTADFNASLFWELGLEPFPVSAVTGLGTGELLDVLVEKMPPMHHRKEEEELTSVAIIGRPNTGKSSLLNALVGKERAIVSKIPGTTRDAIDCQATLFSGERIKLIDTAGIRRRTAVYGSAEKVEPLMVDRSIKALQQCNIAVLMIDCYEGVRLQDAQIIEMAREQGCGLVVVANKFDLLDRKDWNKQTVHAIVKQQLRKADWACVVVTSLKDEHPLKAISKAILTADQHHSQRLSTSTVSMIIEEAVHFRPPPASKTGKKGRVYYASQVATRPPTFVLFVNDATLFGETYRKYIEKHLRENVVLEGTSIRVVFRGKPGRPLK